MPLVGHNCLADLAFLFSTFADIPESYERFKASVHDAFPVILDTKHVAAFGASANWWQWSNTALEALYTELLPSADASAGATPRPRRLRPRRRTDPFITFLRTRFTSPSASRSIDTKRGRTVCSASTKRAGTRTVPAASLLDSQKRL